MHSTRQQHSAPHRGPSSATPAFTLSQPTTAVATRVTSFCDGPVTPNKTAPTSPSLPASLAGSVRKSQKPDDFLSGASSFSTAENHHQHYQQQQQQQQQHLMLRSSNNNLHGAMMPHSTTPGVSPSFSFSASMNNNMSRSSSSTFAAQLHYGGGGSPHIMMSASMSAASAEAAVATAEHNYAMRCQLEEHEAQSRSRQTRLEELLVVQASTNTACNNLRRRQIALDPLRHTVTRLTQEVKRMEAELNALNNVLEGPERRMHELQARQARAEAIYVERFELRPHRLSDAAMIKLGGLAKADLEEFEAERRREAIAKRHARQQEKERVERERVRRFEENDPDASGLEDLLVRCGCRNSTAGGVAQLQELYGAGSSVNNNININNKKYLLSSSCSELTSGCLSSSALLSSPLSLNNSARFSSDINNFSSSHLQQELQQQATNEQKPCAGTALGATSSAAAALSGFLQPAKRGANNNFDAQKWTEKHFHVPIRRPSSPQRAGRDEAKEKEQHEQEQQGQQHHRSRKGSGEGWLGVCPSNVSVLTQYSDDPTCPSSRRKLKLRERIRKELAGEG